MLYKNKQMENIKTICVNKLEALSGSITLSDKKEAELQIPISRATLDKYLKGDVVKIETATQLIKFFTGRVNSRMKDLRATNVA